MVKTGWKQPRIRRLASNGGAADVSRLPAACIFASAAWKLSLSGQICQVKTICSPSFAATARRKSVCLPAGTKSSHDSTISRQPWSLNILAPFFAHFLGVHLVLGDGNDQSGDVDDGGSFGRRAGGVGQVSMLAAPYPLGRMNTAPSSSPPTPTIFVSMSKVVKA